MLIAEYDYELDLEVQRSEAMEIGIEKGIEYTLIELLCKKLLKGKSLETIIDELEVAPEKVQPIYDIARDYMPDYDVDTIYAELCKRKQAIS